MKKTLIASAILATLAATSANAGVTVFQDDTSKVDLNGRIQAGMSHIKTDVAGRSDNTNESYFRMGFNAESMLTEELTAIAAVEMQWDISDNGQETTVLSGGAETIESGVNTRLAYAGVKGDFGQVTFGRQYNSDVVISDWIDNSLITGDVGYKATSKESNVLQYQGTFDALYVAAQVQLENDNQQNGEINIFGQALTTSVTDLKKSDMGLTAVYSFDFGLDLGASFMAEKYKGDNEELKANTMLLGANYKVAGFTLGGVYGITDLDLDLSGTSTDDKAKGFGLSVAYEFDKVTVLARYNKSKLDDADTDLVKEYTFGAKYDFNSNFNVMAEYMSKQIDDEENEFHVAAQYNF